MPHDLNQLQRWLQSVITHPGGIAAGIESEGARGEIDVSADEVEQVIGRSQALSSIERLEIYGNAYYARLLECLRESFPVLVHAMGEELFNSFALGYLQSYPSTSYTLLLLGGSFARYLEETRPDRDGDGGDENGPHPGPLPEGEGEIDRSVGWPDLLVDLARLEWTIAEVFDGPGVENERVLDRAGVLAIPPDRWPEARLVPVPCLRLLSFRYRVNDYFTAVRQDQQPELPEPAADYVAITRINYVVRRLALSRTQFELLSALVAGKPVGEAIGAVAESAAGDLEALAGELREWFQQWAEAGLFLAAELPGQ